MTLRHRLAALAMLAAAAAHAQDSAPQSAPHSAQVRSWAAACANCHGTDGRALPPMAPLAGMDKAHLTQKMLDYKASRVPGATIMHQLAKGYSDEQIAAIAAYFAAQKK